MDLNQFEKINDLTWQISPKGAMRVPAIIYANEDLILSMDQKVCEQLCNVATLPGIVQAAYAMPDAHWGYGFPIGGVAAFDPDHEGVISAGGVGFDISCGVRLLQTNLKLNDIKKYKEQLADALFAGIPSGVGSRSRIHLNKHGLDAMLKGGARWAVKCGYGFSEDLNRIEEQGTISGANPDEVSDKAKERQKDEMGTLGSGNHYLEVQEIVEIFDEKIANILDLNKGDIVISIHCGSRGLGHQIGTEFLRRMVIEAAKYNIQLPDRELACAPIHSSLGEAYLGAMRAGMNCALANRQIITHLVREVFNSVIPESQVQLFYDVSHNICKEEWHIVEGQKKRLFVHRKGATRAFGPRHSDLSEPFATTGQPVIIGGSMGTKSYILVGSSLSQTRSFSSACHGAGRALSRHAAAKLWQGQELVTELATRGILIRSSSYRGVAEEAPLAYKDVSAVVETACAAGLAHSVALLHPLICVKG